MRGLRHEPASISSRPSTPQSPTTKSSSAAPKPPKLMVVCFPRERNLKFRLGILFPAMICHLDYTDETHPNLISGFLLRAVPYVVTGPRCHSSPANRRFFRGITAPQTLHDAVTYNEPGQTFVIIRSPAVNASPSR